MIVVDIVFAVVVVVVVALRVAGVVVVVDDDFDDDVHDVMTTIDNTKIHSSTSYPIFLLPPLSGGMLPPQMRCSTAVSDSKTTPQATAAWYSSRDHNSNYLLQHHPQCSLYYYFQPLSHRNNKRRCSVGG
jgi:hypothetical protein